MRTRAPRRRLLLALGMVFLAASPTACGLWGGSASEDDLLPPPIVGPENGTLMLAGGGALGPEIWGLFVELAGGPDARIVVIPTAGTDESYTADGPVVEALLAAGAGQVDILHTRDREEADSRRFTRPIRRATGIWMPGGRQWRLVDAYLHTRVHEELDALLERGGVVGGTSAGASIQASYLVRGDPTTNQVLIAEDYQEGFGFLEGVAVDQHLQARGRTNDLWELVALRPDLLGIGIDEGTALVVRGDQAQVIGTGSVMLYDPELLQDRRLHELRAGEDEDLSGRSPRRTDAGDKDSSIPDAGR
ncbi:MAG: cyanophycinase [Gemmatimonadales bacterium]|nr:MAG: cyanophycinase [Gemmatimonadales bacterium]